MTEIEKELKRLTEELESLDPGVFMYRDSIVRNLKRIASKELISSEKRKSIAAGMGKVILDDYDFAQSKLGLRLIQFCDQYEEHGLR